MQQAWFIAMGIYAVLIPVTWVAVTFLVAPYGRHHRAGWGPTLNTRWAWMLWESPTVLAFLAFYLLGERAFQPVPLLLLGVWMVHYVDRTFLYPLRMRGRSRSPWLIVLTAVAYNLLNAFVNATWLTATGPSFGWEWLHTRRFACGIVLFVLGLVLNRHSDRILHRLRSSQEPNPTYQVPQGGLYRWVSCPNYLAEMVQWFGWAVLTWSPAGLAFFLYTVANLAPRARTHHRWYQDRFPDYPRDRKALIPLLW